MDPPTIGAMMAVGVGTQMMGQHQAGVAAEEQAEREQAWNDYNARLEEREGREAQEAAAHEEGKIRKEARRTRGTQLTRYGKAGVTFEGSPMAVIDKTASEYEIDALLMRRSGTFARQRHESQADLDRLAGRSALLRGRAKRKASYYSMAGTGLSGAAQTSYMYGSMTGKF